MSIGTHNSWLFRRDFNGTTCIVTANYIPTLSVWGVTCKLNGVPTDHRQSDDPWKDAREMIDTALFQYQQDHSDAVE